MWQFRVMPSCTKEFGPFLNQYEKRAEFFYTLLNSRLPCPDKVVNGFAEAGLQNDLFTLVRVNNLVVDGRLGTVDVALVGNVFDFGNVVNTNPAVNVVERVVWPPQVCATFTCGADFTDMLPLMTGTAAPANEISLRTTFLVEAETVWVPAAEAVAGTMKEPKPITAEATRTTM